MLERFLHKCTNKSAYKPNMQSSKRALVDFYHEERESLLQCCCALFRIAMNAMHPLYKPALKYCELLKGRNIRDSIIDAYQVVCAMPRPANDVDVGYARSVVSFPLLSLGLVAAALWSCAFCCATSKFVFFIFVFPTPPSFFLSPSLSARHSRESTRHPNRCHRRCCSAASRSASGGSGNNDEYLCRWADAQVLEEALLLELLFLVLYDSPKPTPSQPPPPTRQTSPLLLPSASSSSSSGGKHGSGDGGFELDSLRPYGSSSSSSSSSSSGGGMYVLSAASKYIDLSSDQKKYVEDTERLFRVLHRYEKREGLGGSMMRR